MFLLVFVSLLYKLNIENGAHLAQFVMDAAYPDRTIDFPLTAAEKEVVPTQLKQSILRALALKLKPPNRPLEKFVTIPELTYHLIILTHVVRCDDVDAAVSRFVSSILKVGLLR